MSWGRHIGKVEGLRVQSASTASQLRSCMQLISWSLQWQRVIGRAMTVLVLHPCHFFVWTTTRLLAWELPKLLRAAACLLQAAAMILSKRWGISELAALLWPETARAWRSLN